MGLIVATKFATSFEKINSCDNEDDAAMLGSRHSGTQSSLKMGMCHFIDSECAFSLMGNCQRRAYHYCCYDTKMTKVLVEQIKAQFGHDWAHCSDIKLEELKHLSFKPCDPTAPDWKGGFDGAHQTGNYDPFGSYQYKNKCLDLTEFVNYAKMQLDLDIDQTEVAAGIKDSLDQAFEE